MKNNDKDYLIDEPDLLSSDDSQFAPKQEVFDEKTQITEEEKEVVKTKHARVVSVRYYVFTILAALALIATLIYCISFLPRFGATGDNPTLNDIYTEYIENGIQKTGATNFVTGMILDYRAFDTLGESFVLFTAVNCVLILLQGFKDKKEEEEEHYQPFRDSILKVAASFLVPAILLFGAYVILNGSISPGGGFSGGAIMGAGLILYALAFGFEQSGRFFKNVTFKTISSIALLTYCGSKTYSFLTGAMDVESIVPLGVPGAILSGGIIFILNVCVGLVVTCTMFGFYSLFKKGEI